MDGVPRLEQDTPNPCLAQRGDAKRHELAGAGERAAADRGRRCGHTAHLAQRGDAGRHELAGECVRLDVQLLSPLDWQHLGAACSRQAGPGRVGWARAPMNHTKPGERCNLPVHPPHPLNTHAPTHLPPPAHPAPLAAPGPGPPGAARCGSWQRPAGRNTKRTNAVSTCGVLGKRGTGLRHAAQAGPVLRQVWRAVQC